MGAQQRFRSISIYPNTLARARCTVTFHCVTGTMQLFPSHIRTPAALRVLLVFMSLTELFLPLLGPPECFKLCNGRAETCIILLHLIFM